MALHPDVEARLAGLTEDQRAAATAPPGPVLCVAPAGSGKTTTLVARIAWLVQTGVTPPKICAVTFNRRAAEELSKRVQDALRPLGVNPDKGPRIRTFHALGLEILRAAGRPVEPLLDRVEILRTVLPSANRGQLGRLDTVISRLKLDLGVTAEDVARDPEPGPTAEAFLAYERELARRGGLDFDDLVAGALQALERDGSLLARWREACTELLVDEVQDVDRSQLRLALLLVEPGFRIFLVGDDDQSIYGWRLADVRRVIGLAATVPGLRRVDLVTNFRCPRSVVERAVRLVGHNRERFTKEIRARPSAPGRLVLAPDDGEDLALVGRLIDGWPDDDSTRAILARTNRELLPAIAVAIEREIPFQAAAVPMLLDDPRIDELLDEADRLAASENVPGALLPLLAQLRQRPGDLPSSARSSRAAEGGSERLDRLDPRTGEETLELEGLVAALVAWAIPYPTVAALRGAITRAREALARLHREDAALTFATAHATKGLEFDHVAVIGCVDGRFPNARALADAADPDRALEEERRLAYVAWTRARRSLTLAYDPAAPSVFLREAFTAEELSGRG